MHNKYIQAIRSFVFFSLTGVAAGNVKVDPRGTGGGAGERWRTEEVEKEIGATFIRLLWQCSLSRSE